MNLFLATLKNKKNGGNVKNKLAVAQHIFRRNTVSLSAPLRVFTPTRKRVPGLEFHSIRELSRL
jgi:hypothetical protein